MAKTQLKLDFEPGILDLYGDILEVCRAGVAQSGKPQKMIAADLDMKPGFFNRAISGNEHDTANFPLKLFPLFLKSIGNDLPLKWVNAGYYGFETPEEQLQRLIQRADRLIADQQSLPAIIRQIKELKEQK